MRSAIQAVVFMTMLGLMVQYAYVDNLSEGCYGHMRFDVFHPYLDSIIYDKPWPGTFRHEHLRMKHKIG